MFTYGLTPGCDLWADQVESQGLEGMRFRLHYTPRCLRRKAIQSESSAFRMFIRRGSRPHSSAGPAQRPHRPAGRGGGTGRGTVVGRDPARAAHGRATAPLAMPGVNGSTLLDDTYNSSPESAIAALNLLDELGERGVEGARSPCWAICSNWAPTRWRDTGVWPPGDGRGLDADHGWRAGEADRPRGRGLGMPAERVIHVRTTRRQSLT